MSDVVVERAGSEKQTVQKRRVGDGTPGPGRPKGVPNKATVALKEMIRTALDEAGGVDYLMRQADENPTAFMTLVGKLLPLDVSAKVGVGSLEEMIEASMGQRS